MEKISCNQSSTSNSSHAIHVCSQTNKFWYENFKRFLSHSKKIASWHMPYNFMFANWKIQLINFSLYLIFIFRFFLFQTLSVLNPLRTTDKTIFEDTDMAGPLVFCLAFGGFLLLVSKYFFLSTCWEKCCWYKGGKEVGVWNTYVTHLQLKCRSFQQFYNLST